MLEFTYITGKKVRYLIKKWKLRKKFVLSKETKTNMIGME